MTYDEIFGESPALLADEFCKIYVCTTCKASTSTYKVHIRTSKIYACTYHMYSTGTESDKVSLIMPFLIFVYCCCSFLVCSVVSKDMIGLSTKIFFFIMSMYTKEQSWVNVTL